MKLSELKQEIQKYQYFEDTSVINIALASVIATRLQLKSPVWLIIIGASSGGKSQILRPLSLTDKEFLHRVDDLTENTFLSGMQGKDSSLLTKIGELGMLVVSDLTVLFSKNSESKNAILSQFRMIYDGEMVKYVGTKPEPLQWKGSLGVLAGSTPSIYTHFEEVADMGERFVYYRMKDFDAEKATRLAINSKVHGHELDKVISDIYKTYIKDVIKKADKDSAEVSDEVKERIISISLLAEKIRTPVHTNWQNRIDRIPVSAMPMRIAKQLSGLATSLSIMQHHETGSYDLSEENIYSIEWCAYSLANEEKRACLRVLASIGYGEAVAVQVVADKIGLASDIAMNVLDNLHSVGILERSSDTGSLTFTIKSEKHYATIRRMEGLTGTVSYGNRGVSQDEVGVVSRDAEAMFEKF
jgi:hypothetical protein